MSTNNLHKELLDHGNDNSDISEVGPEDLANIAKGVDDMDDALFGFKPKASVKANADKNAPERSELSIKKKPNVLDFPEGDPLADISLSDDDFFDMVKNSPAVTKTVDNKLAAPKKIAEDDKLAKSKKIANLFGLDDEDVVVTDSKKTGGAADWLGIKDSPVKDTPFQLKKDKPNIKSTEKDNLTHKLLGNDPLEPNNKNVIDAAKATDVKKTDVPEVKQAAVVSSVTKEQAVTINQKSEFPEHKSSKHPTKVDNILGLLGDKTEPKANEIAKEKRNNIFDELFGDSNIGSKNSRRNSAVKTPDNDAREPTGDVRVTEELSEYTPSSGVARRSGLGRRRDAVAPAATLPAPTTLCQEDWLKPSDVKENIKVPKTEVKTSAVDNNENLPSWLGGHGGLPQSKPRENQFENVGKENIGDKDPVAPAQLLSDKGLDPDNQVVDTVKEMLAKNSDQNQQTALALQRTEAQLLTSLELQTTQSSLAAVCARQHSLLNTQERQLAELVQRQTDSQRQVESQLGTQQQRIQQLLQVLATNAVFLPQTHSSIPHSSIEEKSLSGSKQEHAQDINNLEVEIQKADLENEELRIRMKLIEKHYKMELESLQMQHKREIESWEDQLIKQKELTEQIKEDFKGRISRLKENEEELIAEHNERVRRLRDESTDDMKQLMQIHQLTLEQVAAFGKLVPASTREERKQSQDGWKPLSDDQLSEKEKELQKKEKMLTVIKEKLENQRQELEKHTEETEAKQDQEKIRNEEFARQLKQEQTQLKLKQHQINQEKIHAEERFHMQRKLLEEMQEKMMSEQTQLAAEKLLMAEGRAKLDALAKLQGVSSAASFDVLQSKAEVHGALEAAREAEMQAVEEKRRLRDKERALDTQRWKLQEFEEDLAMRSEHLDKLMQVSEAKEVASLKALEEAKQLEKRAEEKLLEVERRHTELRDKQQSLMRLKLEIAQEEVRLRRKRDQLEHILPQLTSDEAFTLQPIKGVIDPKMLIMRLRAEKEFEGAANPDIQGDVETNT